MSQTIDDVLKVLAGIRNAYRASMPESVRSIRIRVVRAIARERGVNYRTIADAYIRRLAPALERTPAFDHLVQEWLAAVFAWDWPEPDKAAFPLAQLGRKTGDRVRDLDDATRGKLAAALRGLPGGDRAVVLVEQVVALEAREERVALGDTLPAGLRLVIDTDHADDTATPTEA